ncbi:MAG: translation initiation factor IF-2 [Candidatus Zixiibacteriota bacterium]
MAAKRRVHEIAKSLDRTSKEIVVLLNEIGVDAKAANSSVTVEEEARLRAHLFGIKDETREEQLTLIPEMAKPAASKARLRKKAPRKEEPAPPPEEAPAAAETPAAEEAEKEKAAETPAAAPEATAEEEKAATVEKEAPAEVKTPEAAEPKAKEPEVKGEKETTEKSETSAEESADSKTGKPKKAAAPRPKKEDGRDKAQAEIEEDRGEAVKQDALRRLAKADRLARPRSRRPARRGGRSDKGGRGRRGIPARSHAHKGKRPSTIEPKVQAKKKARIRRELTLGELAFNLDVATEKIVEVYKGDGGRNLTPLSLLSIKEQADVAGALDFDVEAVEAEIKTAPRRPVVTVLGHVDHGKTTLLDAIRKTNVVDSESGGITQHIGASVVKGKFGEIVFIDTPGHEVFTQMRARGTQITDIVILVVAADDGVMPQTLESISHAKAAHVPVVVAITKMDKPEADPLRVKRGLAEHGVTTEDWGGEVLAAEISALKGEGLDKLMEAVSLQAEIMELKGEPDARATGVVLESTLDRGRGAVVTVLVRRGSLKIGDSFVVGKKAGRVRAMFDADGKKIKEAGLSTPVSILGAEGVPDAGDVLVAMPDDKTARSLAALLSVEPEKAETAEPVFSLDEWYQQLQEGGKSELNLVVKADVAGSAEALLERLNGLGNDEVGLKVLHSAVGAVNEGDVILAGASEAVLVAFRVGVESKAKKLAQQEGVEIRNYDVIYETIEDVRAALEGLLEPEIVTEVTGAAEVRQVFGVTAATRVAGSMVTSGRVYRGARVRVRRDGDVIHEGHISSLRRFRDDAKEVQQGLECGIQIGGYGDVEEGDVIEILEDKKIARRLERK